MADSIQMLRAERPNQRAERKNYYFRGPHDCVAMIAAWLQCIASTARQQYGAYPLYCVLRDDQEARRFGDKGLTGVDHIEAHDPLREAIRTYIHDVYCVQQQIQHTYIPL